MLSSTCDVLSSTAATCDVKSEVGDSRLDNESVGCGSGDSGHFSPEVSAAAVELNGQQGGSTPHRSADAMPPVVFTTESKNDQLSSAVDIDGAFLQNQYIKEV
jgi:hypothetical protein